MSIEREVSPDGRIQTWWLARPEARNAVNYDMWVDLDRLAREANTDDMLRMVVLRGRGGHFSAGADIASLGRSLAADHEGTTYRVTNARAEESLLNVRVPTVALIEGFCVGGGVQIAAACDIRIAHEASTFGVTPARLGISYPAKALERLVALVGVGVASELLLTGDLYPASWALSRGLVSSLTDDVDTSLASLADSLLARSPFTQRASKELLRIIEEKGDASIRGRELETESLDAPDLNEGLAAFIEKRPPRFG